MVMFCYIFSFAFEILEKSEMGIENIQIKGKITMEQTEIFRIVLLDSAMGTVV